MQKRKAIKQTGGPIGPTFSAPLVLSVRGSLGGRARCARPEAVLRPARSVPSCARPPPPGRPPPPHASPGRLRPGVEPYATPFGGASPHLSPFLGRSK